MVTASTNTTNIYLQCLFNKEKRLTIYSAEKTIMNLCRDFRNQSNICCSDILDLHL